MDKLQEFLRRMSLALRLIRIFGVISVLFLHQTASYGQTAKQEGEDGFELSDVSLEDLLNIGIVSASRKKQSVSDAPATAYVITREQIQNRGYPNLSELLEDIPEVEVQRNSNPEFRNIFTIRGIAGNEKFLILLNGIRITPATGDSYIPGSNLSLVNAQRVEVILGPASALYGVDAFSGIINIITSPEQKAQTGAEISTAYGNYNTSNNSFSGIARSGRVTFSLAGNYYFSAEPDYSATNPDQFRWYNSRTRRDGNIVQSPYYQTVNNLDIIRERAGGSFYGAALSEGFSMPSTSHFLNGEISYGNFTIGYLRHDEKHSSGYGFDPKYTVYDPSSFIRQKQEVVYGRHSFVSFNKKWGLQSSFTQSLNETNPASNYAGALSSWQRGFIYSYGQSSRLEEQFNYDFSNKISLTAGGLYENLSALPRTGLSQKPFEKGQPGSLQELYYIGAAGYVPAASGQASAFNDSFTVKQNFYYLSYQNYGAYAQVQVSPWRFLEITLGSRYDYNTRFGSTVNPRAGFVFLPGKKFRFKVLYGEAYLAPSPQKGFLQEGAIYSYQPSSGKLVADYFRIPNPYLKPEKLREAEASFSWLFSQNFSAGINGYLTQTENMIDLNAAAPDALAPENLKVTRLQTSVNQGTSEMYGGTVRANLLLHAGSISFNWFAAYSYTDGSINDQPLILTAKNTVKGNVEISHKRFSLCPRFIYRDRSFSSQTDPATGALFSNDPFTVVHLAAGAVVSETRYYKLKLTLKVSNLLNNRYYHVYYGGDDGMGFTPQDPVRYMGGINLYF